MLKEKIIDVNTGEESFREYTEEEMLKVKEEQEAANLRIAEAKKRESKRASALSKLIDLGLTEEEIAAL